LSFLVFSVFLLFAVSFSFNLSAFALLLSFYIFTSL